VVTLFERFTDRARRVVVLAQEEARLLNHSYIGTEHILLGLIHEGEGVAAKALESLAISLEAVRAQVEEIIGQGGSSPSGHIPFTPRAKKVLELSLREALQLGHNYIGTEHILLGLLREGEVLFVSIAEGFELRDDFSEHAGPLDFREGDSAALGFRVEVFDLAKGGAFEFLQADVGCLLKKTETQFPPACIGIRGRRADLEEGFVNIANHGSEFHREVEKRSG
jgi:hypothetical protein